MRKVLVFSSIFLLSSLLSFAGKSSTWPNVKYSYAMVYLYNIDGELHGKHQILKDGKLDKTVQGEGKKLSNEQLEKLDGIFSSGAAIDELLNGLSGCYIPRHGIVYYDEKNKPVASMSICFECEGIRFYTPDYPRNHYASTPALIKKAEEKLQEIKSIVSELGFKTDFKMAQIQNEENFGSMYFTSNKAIDSIFPAKITIDNFRTFLSDTNDLSIKEHIKYTHGGDKYYFHTITKGNSIMEFSGSDEMTTLSTADVQWTDVQICKNISIGMRLEDVQSLMPVYDGIAYPEMMEIKNEDASKRIEFHFFENKLASYKIEVLNW